MALLYHGIPSGICLATSNDDDLITWTKSPHNPVIGPPIDSDAKWKLSAPGVWREGDTYYLLIGDRQGSGSYSYGSSKDVAFLFQSKDLVHWDYKHRLYEPGEESDNSCPDFFSLGPKHMMLFCCSTDGKQQTRIIYDPQSASLSIDISQSSGSSEAADRRTQALPLELRPGEPLKLRVFLDRSVLEVFANGRQCVAGKMICHRKFEMLSDEKRI